MKIKTVEKSYEEVCQLKRPPHVVPKRPSLILGLTAKMLSIPNLAAVKFTYTTKNMDRAGNGPWLILMNHSSFLDLEIASRIIPMRYHIVCTSDGFVGKEKLMRNLGCIPTKKAHIGS